MCGRLGGWLRASHRRCGSATFPPKFNILRALVRVLTDHSQMARSRDPFHHSARPVPSRRRPYTSLDDTIVWRAYLTTSAEGPTNYKRRKSIIMNSRISSTNRDFIVYTLDLATALCIRYICSFCSTARY